MCAKKYFLKIFLIFFPLEILYAKNFSCSLEVWPILYILEESALERDLYFIKKTNCSDSILERVKEYVVQTKEKNLLDFSHLSKTQEIKIFPEKMEILPFQSLFLLEENFFLKLESETKIFATDKKLSLEGRKLPLGYFYKEIENMGNKIKLKGFLAKKVRVLAITSSISSQGMVAENIEEKEIITERPQEFFPIEEKQSLKFYKTLRRLEEGHFLKKIDLIKHPLVMPQKRVKIVYYSNGLTLEGFGVALGQGKYEERVEIKMSSGKKQMAKVIGFSEVALHE